MSGDTGAQEALEAQQTKLEKERKAREKALQQRRLKQLRSMRFGATPMFEGVEGEEEEGTAVFGGSFKKALLG